MGFNTNRLFGGEWNLSTKTEISKEDEDSIYNLDKYLVFKINQSVLDITGKTLIEMNNLDYTSTDLSLDKIDYYKDAVTHSSYDLKVPNIYNLMVHRKVFEVTEEMDSIPFYKDIYSEVINMEKKSSRRTGGIKSLLSVLSNAVSSYSPINYDSIRSYAFGIGKFSFTERIELIEPDDEEGGSKSKGALYKLENKNTGIAFRHEISYYLNTSI